MAEKTIPALPEISTITEFALFPVDSGIETFKMTGANLALFIANQILPAGLTIPFAGGTVPSGWLLADGTAVSRTTYLRLFTAIGTTYGVGDGSTTFNLPDGRGRVIAGKDNMGGSAANRLTLAESGITGTTLGATGGIESFTPSGAIGGTLSIAHTHTFAHYHQWGAQTNNATTNPLYTDTAGSASSTSLSIVAGNRFLFTSAVSSGAGLTAYIPDTLGGTRSFYTTGALGAASGSGATATTSGMSAGSNTTVPGSSFTFTGVKLSNAQPTIVLNYLVKA